MCEIPGVCIMIPTYNQAKYLNKAIESALAQDYPHIEIVISDDCSTDNTAAILQSFINNPKIKYRSNATNLGRVANYRICLNEYVKADWVINLDGDDYYTNDRFISQAMNAIRANGVNDTLFYQGANIRKFGQVEKLSGPNMDVREKSITAMDYFFKFFERNYFCHMATLYNRRLAIENNFYDFNILSADILSFLRLCLNFGEKKVIVSKNIAGIWLGHAGNISKTLYWRIHLNNFRLYISLYYLAIETGYNKLQCFQWLLSAGYTYAAGYILKSIAILRRLNTG